MEALGYVASVLMGVSLGMIGGGGSILTVPILVYLFGKDPMVATAYSLFIVGLTALVGALQAGQKGEIDIKRGLIFAGPSFLGVYLVRAFVVPALPQEIFHLGSLVVTKAMLTMLVFAVLMVAASFSMIRSKKSVAPASAADGHLDAKKLAIIGLEGLVVGGVTGFVGAGGGFLIIPALVLLTGMSMKIAVGTSLMIIAIKSLFGFLGDVQKQAGIEWLFLVTISAISVAGLFVGAKLKSKVKDEVLKKGFGYFVLIMGLIILIDNLRK
jgi:uncharacterized membrane protein YfcA